ncbi:putative viral early transcription factor small subunit [Yalta virus]|nr:putative viral early transcription factor small subunit [Yalta virus]
MNVAISKSIAAIPNNSTYPKILPHQLGTLDFMLKQIINENKNILMFHQMGSGKTIVSLMLAALLSKNGKNINVVLPNNNIKELWISKINVVKRLLPYANYNFNNFIFETKKDLIHNIVKNKTKTIKLKNIYNKTVFIIDEAHNLFGNTGSESLLFLQSLFYGETKRPVFVLVTGSPITNTLLTFKDLYSLLSYKQVNENVFVVQNGNKVFNYSLNKEGESLIKKDLDGCISYFKNEKNNIPPSVYRGQSIINIPVIPCVMSNEQTQNYYNVKKKVTNEMFFKYLLDVSFTAMGDFQNIQNFENYIKSGRRFKLTDTLYINNGHFQGDELTTLKNSSKLKYFVEEKIYNIKNRSKTFIYFSNARIGGRFIKDVMNAQGIQEYGNKELSNFVCYYCGKERKCVKCKPMTYIIITSIYITTLTKKDIDNLDDDYGINNQSNQINNLIDIYNSAVNDKGEEICFIFGSKIISESYTLKEARDIWFLTIPDSLSELTQIIARCLRNFSYKDINEPVYINIPITIQNDFNIKPLIKKKKEGSLKMTQYLDNQDQTNEYIGDLIEKEDVYSYDLKKVLYLEIKSQQTNHLHNLFKEMSIKTKEKPYKDLLHLYLIEVIRRVVYSSSSFTIDLLFSKIPDGFISKDDLKEILNKFISDGLIVFNKRFKQVFLIESNEVFYIKPIKIQPTPFLYKIEL